jgi:ATP-dependent Lon protease
MATAMASLLTGKPIRRDLAMTGEITLRGRVLPIGGLKSKLLAAHLAGVKTVLIPRRNEKDLVDVPEEVRNQLKIIPVETMDEVLAQALIDRARPATRIKAERAARQKAVVRRARREPVAAKAGGPRRKPATPKPALPVTPLTPADQPPVPNA